MKIKLITVVFICFFNNYIIAQNTNPSSKYAPQSTSQNMDWYQKTFDVNLDGNDTLNPMLINAINFNDIEQLRLENQDVEIEIEVDGTEIEIILFSYQKCAILKNGVNSNPITK
jgi:hypothetical protein